MEEDDYIKNNAELLKLLDKKEAVLLFTQQQPEKQQIDSLKQEIESLQTQLKSNEDRKNKLQGSINSLSEEYKKLEAKQKEKLGQAEQFCEQRNKMIEALPPSLRKKATEQFKILSQSQDEFNTKPVKPEKISTSAGFFTKVLHGKQLAEFDAQFENIQKDVESGRIGNFDVSADFAKIANDINQKYETEEKKLQSQTADKQKELTLVDENINRDKTTLQSKETLLTQNEKSLEEKVNRFSAVYDTHPFVDTQNIDPVVQKAMDNGQILGSEREVQVLAQLLSMGCQNSDIAKEVLSAAIDKGTKFIIGEQFSGVGGNYGAGVISINTSSMNNLDTDARKVAAISTLVHESRHACQDTGENIIRDNWANTFMQSSLKEVDAYSIQVATMYQMNQKLGTDVGKQHSGNGHEYMLKAFADEYEQNHDIRQALNKAALEWNEQYGYEYKTQQYISQDWCSLTENAATVHPEEIAKRNNIMYQGQPYLDIEKATEQILTISKSDYDTIVQKLEAAGKKDDSLQYFTVKTPDFKRDDNGNVLKDEFGFDIIDYKITPPAKQFVYSANTPQTELREVPLISMPPNIPNRLNEQPEQTQSLIQPPIAEEMRSASQERSVNEDPFSGMTRKQQFAFIQSELRQGKNSFLTSDVKPIAPTREKSTENGKVVPPSIKINKGMEI